MIVYPNAKINIGLNITEKRPDGFHNLESAFFPINLCDILEVVPTNNENTFSSSGIAIPGNTDNNLCLQAWQLLHKDFSIPTVKTHLHKQIPIGAGLGGGSADGAFMLKVLNNIFNLKQSTKELENYAAKLGSDCAFFIKNKPAFAKGRGEILSELTTTTLPTSHIVLINPGIHISTQEAYANIKPQKPAKSLQELMNSNCKQWQDAVINDFESPIEKKHPTISDIKQQLLNNGAFYAAMSGSGSSVFGLFQNNPKKDLSKVFKKYFFWQGQIMG